jgi:chromosome segregation ATPase
MLCCAVQAARDRAALLEAQNQRMNQELSAAEAAHHKLTQQLAAADLHTTKLSQQLGTLEASQNRSGQQLAAADAQNAKLLQQMSAVEAEVHALRSELGGMHASRQQSEVACEQLRQLQGDHHRQVAQLRAELAEASQENLVSSRDQHGDLAERDCSMHPMC